MEEDKFKYDGYNDRWVWKINGRDATEEIEKIKKERAELRRLYAEYAGTASRIIDDCKDWIKEETTIHEFKQKIMQKIDECLQSKNGSFKEISEIANKCGITKDELNNCIETMIDKNNE